MAGMSRPLLVFRMLSEFALAYASMYLAAHLHRYHDFGSTPINVLVGLIPAALGVALLADGLKLSTVIFSR